MSNKLRKRYLVSEGELFLLWAEIEQVRHQETKESFKQRFKAMMREAQEVQLTIKEKGGNHES